MNTDTKFIFAKEAQEKVIEQGILTQFELEYLKELLDKANRNIENSMHY